MKHVEHLGFEIVVPDHVAQWISPRHEAARIHDIIQYGVANPGGLLIDVGAEHGWQSAMYARHGGWRMILVEPVLSFWPNIHRCWTENDLCPPVACVPLPAAQTDHPPLFYRYDSWPLATTGPEAEAGPYVFDDFPTISLDRFGWRKIDGISIDVEGAELEVLRGAWLLLGQGRPTVWCSIHPEMLKERDQSREMVLAYMKMQEYTPTHLATDHEEHWRFDPK